MDQQKAPSKECIEECSKRITILTYAISAILAVVIILAIIASIVYYHNVSRQRKQLESLRIKQVPAQVKFNA